MHAYIKDGEVIQIFNQSLFSLIIVFLKSDLFHFYESEILTIFRNKADRLLFPSILQVFRLAPRRICLLYLNESGKEIYSNRWIANLGKFTCGINRKSMI